MLLTGGFTLDQLARKKGSEKPKGFYKQGGKTKPINEKKGIREDNFSNRPIEDKIAVTKKIGGSYPSSYYETVKMMQDKSGNNIINSLKGSTIQQLRIIAGMNHGKGRDPISKKLAEKLIKEKNNEVSTVNILHAEEDSGKTVWTAVINDYDVEALRDYLGGPKYAGNYDGYYAEVKDGDYGRVYGFQGIPHPTDMVYRVN